MTHFQPRDLRFLREQTNEDVSTCQQKHTDLSAHEFVQNTDM